MSWCFINIYIVEVRMLADVEIPANFVKIDYHYKRQIPEA